MFLFVTATLALSRVVCNPVSYNDNDARLTLVKVAQSVACAAARFYVHQSSKVRDETIRGTSTCALMPMSSSRQIAPLLACHAQGTHLHRDYQRLDRNQGSRCIFTSCLLRSTRQTIPEVQRVCRSYIGVTEAKDAVWPTRRIQVPGRPTGRRSSVLQDASDVEDLSLTIVDGSSAVCIRASVSRHPRRTSLRRLDMCNGWSSTSRNGLRNYGRYGVSSLFNFSDAIVERATLLEDLDPVHASVAGSLMMVL